MKSLTLTSNNSKFGKRVLNAYTKLDKPVTQAKLEADIRKITASKIAEGIIKKTKANMKRFTKREKKESFADKFWRWVK